MDSNKIYDIVVLGAGESGVGAALLCHAKGLSVFISDMGCIADKYKSELDKYAIPYEENHHSENIILNAKEVVKSPGIPEKAPIIQSLLELQIPIISEIELAGRYTDAFMICITGSNGKTTTTMWTYHLLKKQGLDVGLAGNVGFSLARQVAYDPHRYYVIELSSFQLDNMYDFHANIAVLLNITPDHLDRYHYQFDLYAQAKMRIIQNQTDNDSFIYWAEDPFIARWIKEHEMPMHLFPFSTQSDESVAACTQCGGKVLSIMDNVNNEDFVIDIRELALKGPHNLQNAMAVALIGQSVGVDESVLRSALKDFVNVPHRLEPIATINQVEYINDSKATNINSTQYALQSMTKPTILILGGTDKGNDYGDIEALVLEHAKALIFMCKDNAKLHRAFDNKVDNIYDASSMREAVDVAHHIAQPGDTVLLSPACASFDLFKNYEDRGDQFRECVNALK
ncbi:UDP-N-acetylmuramoyl-L-alanine--D-glutamate ligase [Porphyromonas pogonae]|uniref:UDP-N-acetylmuramoyl-L-alanine--D-glutamate ligase n=1 Tax=Porphyromonas pogonae TaxID=867595 RepID=UPI002E75C245|nr:UDP-N-acetylmuramoyl-L-alanine--D-glutamate ligase [Porphyromonas pogonae]